MKYIKQISLTILLAFSLYTVQAQIYAWVKPSAFLEDEEIIIYFNVCATDLTENEGPVFLWSSANGGVFENSGECTVFDVDVWTFTMTPASFYGAAIDSINGVLKNDDGSIETDVFMLQPFDFSIAQGQMLTIYPQPASFGESISLIFNAALSDRDDLTGVSPIFMWGWIPGGADVPGQGTWGSYTDKALCQQIDGDIWRKEFIPLDYWETTDPMTEFGCLFVNSAGSKQTEDHLIPLSPPFACERPSISFPRLFTQDDIVTIICDTKKEEYSMLANVDEVYIWTYTNEGGSTDYNPLPEHNWIIYPPDKVDRAQMTNVGDGVYHITFIAYKYYEVDDPEYIIDKLTYIFRNKLGNIESLEVAIEVKPPSE
ncbi:MAG: hypothetical protein IMY70_05240 [Bacteroidetes bacterium]|nr:hypothetical protein [Bacteroidota bacterium]